MADAPTSDPRSLSPWWGLLLLLLPLALGSGWLMGRLPVPAATGIDAAAESARAAHRLGGQPGGPTAPAAERGFTARAVETPPSPEASASIQPSAEYSQWTTLDNATSQSQRNGKPVLIDFNADWCGPCQALKHEVFEDGARGQAVQTAVIPVSIVDRRREDGSNPQETETLQQRYDVTAFPTLVVYSPQTGRMVKTRGYGDAGETLRWITEAAKQVR